MTTVVIGAGADATQDVLAAMQARDLDLTVFQDGAGQGEAQSIPHSSLLRAKRSKRRATFRFSSSRLKDSVIKS